MSLCPGCARHRAEEERDKLTAEIKRMLPVYEAAKRMRAHVPAATAAEMRERDFHATTCDLVEAIDLSIAAEFTASPYRGTP